MKKVTFLTIVYLFSAIIFSQTFQFKSNPANYEDQNLLFKMDIYHLKTIEIDNQKFVKIISGAGVYTKKKGFASLPVFSTAVILSADKDMDLEIIPGEYEDIRLDADMLPSKGIIYRNQDPKRIKYEISRESIKDEWYPEKIAILSDPYIVNNERGASVRFFPVRYNAKKKILRVYKTIEVRLTSNNNVPKNPLIKKDKTSSKELDALYKSLFLNYKTTRETLPLGQYGDMLVITTSRDEEAIKPYVEWKRSKGFNVETETVNKGTNVKELIKNKFSENGNLFYVTIVGDYEDIKSDIGTTQNAPMDPMLGCVSGEDNFPDICIGRFSANSPAEVTALVNKTIKYEKEPDVNGEWYGQSLHIASDEGENAGDDNESDIQHMDVLWNNKLSKFTYTQNDTLYDPGVSSASVSERINNKVGLINYIGHGDVTNWVTSGFDNSNIDALTNTDYLPWVISVACVNGAFHQAECFAEHFTKKADGGAVMFLGSTINQPWAPPMMGQDYMMDLLTGGYDYSAHSGQTGISTTEQRTTTGSIIFNSFVLMLKESEAGDVLETVQTWSIFGDPSLQVRTTKPQQITMSNSKVETGKNFTTTLSGSGNVKGIVVSLSQGEKVYTGMTDADGNVTISHNITPGDYTVVASGFNTSTIYKKESIYSDTYYPLVNSFEVKEVSGKINNKIELNENLNLKISVKNFGQQKLPSGQAVLTFSDNRITVTDNDLQISEIDAQGKIDLQGFEFKISEHIPDGEIIKGEVKITAGNVTSTKAINLKAASPLVKIKSTEINDSNFNKNEIFDPGETIDYKITVKNNGSSDAQKLNFELKIPEQFVTADVKVAEIDTLKVEEEKTITFKISAKQNVPLETKTELILINTVNEFSTSDTLDILIGEFPHYIMAEKTDTLDNGRFYDSGGKNENYQINEKLVHTFVPKEKGKSIQLKFVKFDIENGYDFITIYDGLDTTATVLGKEKYTGKDIDETFTATNSAGAITVMFYSDEMIAMSGWEAVINTNNYTGIDNRLVNQIPEVFDLQQNYPNPFNPSTTIKYDLPEDAFVTIEIFNIIGQKVTTLINKEEKKAGVHSIVWKGRNSGGGSVSSGIYFYRISANKFVKTKKMIYLK